MSRQLARLAPWEKMLSHNDQLAEEGVAHRERVVMHQVRAGQRAGRATQAISQGSGRRARVAGPGGGDVPDLHPLDRLIRHGAAPLRQRRSGDARRHAGRPRKSSGGVNWVLLCADLATAQAVNTTQSKLAGVPQSLASLTVLRRRRPRRASPATHCYSTDYASSSCYSLACATTSTVLPNAYMSF